MFLLDYGSYSSIPIENVITKLIQRCNVKIYYGEHDWMDHKSVQQIFIEKNITDITIEYIEHSAHVFMLENPFSLCEKIISTNAQESNIHSISSEYYASKEMSMKSLDSEEYDPNTTNEIGTEIIHLNSRKDFIDYDASFNGVCSIDDSPLATSICKEEIGLDSPCIKEENQDS